MPEYLAPGVYVEEVATRSHAIPGVETCAPLIGGPLERPRYFNGKLLTAEDLEAEQTYGREKMRRLNRLLHGCGVVCGLVVTAAATVKAPWRIRIGTGVALSPAGDEVTLAMPVCLDLAAHRPGRGKRIFIAVRYGESLLRGADERFRSPNHDVRTGDGDDAEIAEPNRIREAAVVGCLAYRLADPWTVLAGISLPPSPRTRLTDAMIDNATVRHVRHGAARTR